MLSAVKPEPSHTKTRVTISSLLLTTPGWNQKRVLQHFSLPGGFGGFLGCRAVLRGGNGAAAPREGQQGLHKLRESRWKPEKTQMHSIVSSGHLQDRLTH